MPSFYQDILNRRYSRREIVRGGAVALGVASLPFIISRPAFAESARLGILRLAFDEITRNRSATHTLAEGYETHTLLRWGDALLDDAPPFHPHGQTAEAQAMQFGYNNDYTAYFSLPHGSRNSRHGLLCVNHEYSIAHLMFPEVRAQDERHQVTRPQVDIEMAAHGLSVAEIAKKNQRWTSHGGRYNRRITATTPMRFSGPAAGHTRLQTTSDPTGERVLGTIGNCAGGVTPWGTLLTAEENFHSYFHGNPSGREADNHARYGVGKSCHYGWYRFHDRFEISREPNEANRFGWIVEIDPYDPESTPVKHTALGRFKHECATCALTPAGRLAVYSGDDEKFEYLYRYVSNGAYRKNNGAANSALLAEGILYAAKFHDDGWMEWLPLIYGDAPLNAKNGFDSQADVLIETRRAADLMGATKMDRPEDIEIDPLSGDVYCVMTHNEDRRDTDGPNPRPHNLHGHILVLRPPAAKGGAGHDAMQYAWDVFIAGGDPAQPADQAFYPGAPSGNGWLSCPDNLAFDPDGRLWIATDGQAKSISSNDGLYAVDIGRGEGPKLFFTGPRGCEIAGPSFTPDGKTLFLSIQHPGDDKESSFDSPSTRWPDFRGDAPPRPAVLAITKKDGRKIGG